jgi:hypothetical protein
MALTDLLVVAALAAVAGYPAIAALLPNPGKPADAGVKSWRQEWSATLIKLIDEIEGGSSHFAHPDKALTLAKELLWEVVGGDTK